MIETQQVKEDIAAAVLFLTRIPVDWQRVIGNSKNREPNIANAYWAFPLVGLIVATAAGLAALLLSAISVPPLIIASVLVVITILLSGGLHEDGLADVADGFGGAFEKARKLEIMRDSRVGAYGVLALIFSVLLRVFCLFELSGIGLGAMLTGLLCASVGGRSAMVALRYLLAPAGRGGLAASIAAPTIKQLQVALGLTAVVIFIALPFSALFPCVLAMAAAVGLMHFLAKRHIGGVSGDVLGATEQLAEIFILIAISSYWASF